MSRPPATTIIIDDLPGKLDNWLIGIDTQFFNMSRAFKGIKLIPAGLHLVHFTIPGENNGSKESQEDVHKSSLRHGYWFECKEGDVFYMYWDKKSETFNFINENVEEEQLNYSKALGSLGEYYNYMISYPEDIAKWKSLTNNTDLELLTEFLPTINGFCLINTMLSSKEEKIALENALKAKDANYNRLEQDEEEINFTIIDFKSRSSTHENIEEVTNNYLDKSWQFDKLYNDDYTIALAELEIAYINFIIIGNFCCNVQWLNLLKFLLMCSKLMTTNKSFTLNFLNLFLSQLTHIPLDYINENAMVNMKYYVQIMENFVHDIFSPELWVGSDCCGKLKMNGLITDRWQKILQLNKLRFNLDIDKLKGTYDDDNMEVFDINDLHDYNGDDEDLPAIV